MTKLIQTNNTNLSALDVMDKLLHYAKVFATSSIIPEHYRKKEGDIFVAVQTAFRMNLDPVMVMQGTYVIHGKLGMTSAFAISLANASGLTKDGIGYDIEGEGEALKVTAFTELKTTGRKISYTIGMKEARAEGWTSNPKYKSLPELMLRYRAATLLIRTHIPHLNGMQMTEELQDVHAAKTVVQQEPVTINSMLDEFIDDKPEVLEAEVTSSAANVETLQELIVAHHISEEAVTNWCKKGNVDAIDELDEDKVQCCIDYILVKSQTDNTQNLET